MTRRSLRPRPAKSEAIAQLLTLVAHELRTPLGVVGGYLKMLERASEGLGESQRKMITEAQRSCSRLAALISEISELGKLDSGLITLARERIDLLALIQQVADQLAGRMHESSDNEVHLEVRGETAGESGLSVIGDPVQLSRAFAAVFRAVLREQPRGGTVVAECRRRASAGGHSAITVVAPQESVQISYRSAAAPFDEFRGGLGVALPIARRIIEHHGGRIWAPAEGPELRARGAAVISLPVSELL